MRVKKPTQEGRRSGVRVRNNIRKNPDGTDVFRDYFETTVEETTVLGTESEFQDTAPSYNINFTGVSLESDTSNTNQYSLMTIKSPLRNPRKTALTSGKSVHRRKVGRQKKKSCSQKKKLTAFSNLDSEFLSPEKTYVDKSVITSPASFTRASLALSRVDLNRSTDPLHLLSMNINSPSTGIPEKVEFLIPESISRSRISLERTKTSRTLRSKKSSIPSSKSLSETPLQHHDSKSSKGSLKKSTSSISPTKCSFSRQADKKSPYKPVENVSSLSHQIISKSTPGLKNFESSKTGITATPSPKSLSNAELKITKNDDKNISQSSFMNSQKKSYRSVSPVKTSASGRGNKKSANKSAEKAATLAPQNTSKSITASENLESSRTLRSGRIYTPTSKSSTDKNVSKSSLQISKKKLKATVSLSKGENPESTDLSNQGNRPEESVVPPSPSKSISTSEVRNDNSSLHSRFRGINEQTSDMSQMQIITANETINSQIISKPFNSSKLTPLRESIIKENELMIDSSMPESHSKRASKSLDKESSQSRIELSTSMLQSSKNLKPSSSRTTSNDLVQEITDGGNLDFKVLKRSDYDASNSTKQKRDSLPTTEAYADHEESRGLHGLSSQNIDNRDSVSHEETPVQNSSYPPPALKDKRQGLKKNRMKAQQPSLNQNSRCNEVNQDERLNKSRVSLSSFKKNSSVEDSCEDINERHYKPNGSSRAKSHEENVDNERQVQLVKSNKTFSLNQSKSGKRANSSNQVGSRFHNSEMQASHGKVVLENEPFNDVSLLQTQIRTANVPLDLNSSKSKLHSPRNSCRDNQHTVSKSNSDNFAQNVAGKDSGNSKVLEESPSQVKRKRRSSPQLRESADERIVDDNVQPSKRSSKTLSQRKNSLTHPGTSEHNTSNHLTKPKKRGRKRVKSKDWNKTPSPTPYVRERPKRNRIRPLAYWKGEHRTFRYTKEGEIVLAETKLVNDRSMRITSREKKPKAKKQKKEDDVLSDQEQLLFYDEASGSEIELVTVFQKLNWEMGKSLGSNPSYKISRLELPHKHTTGYLEFDINGSKDKQYSPISNLQFLVLEGIVEFKVADNIVKLGRKDSLFIPCRTPYSIKNCFERKSVLFFTSFVDD